MGSRLESTSNAVRKRIEGHRFEDEEGEEYESSKYGGFNDYFRRKKIKLQNRDFERRSVAVDQPKIFKGVVAHVNGYTQPSLNDLHNLIVDYGGGFMQYLDGKTTVTHIIASNLTPKKKIEFRKYRVVKPAWVVESVTAGRLLPWERYAVVDEGANQHVLSLESGSVKSQANTQSTRYREQTDTSWYTSQLRDITERLNANDSGISQHDTSSTRESNEQRPQHDRDAQASDADLSLPDHFGGPLDPQVDNHETSDVVKGNVSGATEHEFTEGIMEEPLQQESTFPNSLPCSEVPSGIAPSASRSSSSARQSRDSGVSPKNSALTAEQHNAKLLADPKVWKSTVVNPAFLKQYYEESRLHHLSHWKAELKSQMQALALEKSSSQKSRQKRPIGSRRYILHVDFDCFFAAVSLRKHPEFNDKPTVVAHGGGTGSEIASCNYPARAFGVKNGMWMKTAQQLCPDLKVLPYDFKAYEEASRHFYEVILDLDAIVQSVSIDEALVDISRLCVEAGGHEGRGVQEGSIWREQERAEELAKSIRDSIKERTGCAVSVGIGGNVLLSKVALRKAKPMGQYHVKPEMMLDFLGELNVQDLPGVAHSIGGKLEEIGVKFVKDIRNLTKEKLGTTLGPKTGEKIWEYSRGIDRTEVGEQVIRKSVSAEVNWGVRFATQEQADEFVLSLCEELHKRLVTERVKGKQLTMKLMRRSADSPLDPPKHLGHGKCDTFNKSVVLGVSTNSKDVLGHEAISIMRGWNFPPGELRGIGIQMTKLEPLKGLAESPIDSSQRRLQFNVPPKVKEVKQNDDIVDDVKTSPKLRRSGSSGFQPPPSVPARPRTDESSEQNLLNTLGTQFVLPTQVDPSVLSELPDDIRSKLFPKRTNPPLEPKLPELPIERSHSKSPIPTTSNNAFPSLSQLDQETLDALPPDVRAEVLASYQQSPHKSRNQTVLPQSPRKDRMIKAIKKKTLTPTKKRVGLIGRGRLAGKNSNTGSTLTQSNFVTGNIKRNKNNNSRDNEPSLEEVSPEFLAALPEDIRKEILEQQRRERLRRQGIDLFSKSRFERPGTKSKLPAAYHRPFKPRPPRPTFTAQKLSKLPDLREAAGAWYEEFRDEGPYEEDTTALVTYLRKVIKEEKDMAKATAVVKWLGWLVEQDGGVEEEAWTRALRQIVEGVQAAVKERGLGRVVLDS